MLGSETVLTVRDDTQTAINALNTGIPVAIGSPSSKMSKDIRAFKTLLKKPDSRLTSSSVQALRGSRDRVTELTEAVWRG